MWTTRGTTKTVASASGRKSLSLCGFAIVNDGRFIVNEVDRFNFETTINSIRYFLDQAPPPPGKKYAMIIDNASWHVKAMRLITEDPQYIDIQNSIEFVRLPPYCPHLNPIEQGWRIVRYEVTHNRYFPKLDNLIKSVRNFLDKFRVANDKFKKLFQFSWMGFAN